MDNKVEMCGDCANHQGTSCAMHEGVYLKTASACDDFDRIVVEDDGDGSEASAVSGHE